MERPRLIPVALWSVLARRWVETAVVIAAIGVLTVAFLITPDRKDAAYWAGYTDGQRWVDTGGYRAHEESIAAYCAGRAANRATGYRRGCVAGAHNAMR